MRAALSLLVCVWTKGCRQSGARAVMVPAASWEAFDLDDELPGEL